MKVVKVLLLNLIRTYQIKSINKHSYKVRPIPIESKIKNYFKTFLYIVVYFSEMVEIPVVNYSTEFLPEPNSSNIQLLDSSTEDSGSIASDISCTKSGKTLQVNLFQ